ncbi:tRNA 2-thiouridine(34) synthase MnmA [Candidatus Wolfebacteria bacterium]|nr:MAG: tRNA 2-thiouridine(34) synthase MnmA [Candidatus Wolfebacteria bacterium]
MFNIKSKKNLPASRQGRGSYQTADRKTVFVGLSGGVDSSVSAALLKKQGYEVVGVFIRVWQPDFLQVDLQRRIGCTWRDDRRDAIRVAAHLDIPFLEFDFEDIYKKEVADYMIDEYSKGNTPNPDVMCNKHVKFGAFYDKALSMGADYVATGHYARNKITKEGNLLLTGRDPKKDQSYFLWTLSQDQLPHIIFPIGDIEKDHVRKLAEKFELPTYKKKDSQGVCFLGKLDMKDFLKHYIKEKRGDVLNEHGEIIGYHTGVLFYTLGERHGFTIIKKGTNDKPLYIIAKDMHANTLTVSENKLLHKNKSTDNIVSLIDVNWIVNYIPQINKEYSGRIRHLGKMIPCEIKTINDTTVSVEFKEPTIVSPGQSLVLYDGEVCLGGGIIE